MYNATGDNYLIDIGLLQAGYVSYSIKACGPLAISSYCGPGLHIDPLLDLHHDVHFGYNELCRHLAATDCLCLTTW